MADFNKYHDNKDDYETTDGSAPHEEHHDYESGYICDSSAEDIRSVNGIKDIQRKCSRICLDPEIPGSPVPEEPPKLPSLPIVPKRVSESSKGTPKSKKNSAAINRKRQQQKIDQDNLALLRKIQSIKPFGLSKPSSFIRQKKSIVN